MKARRPAGQPATATTWPAGRRGAQTGGGASVSAKASWPQAAAGAGEPADNLIRSSNQWRRASDAQVSIVVAGALKAAPSHQAERPQCHFSGLGRPVSEPGRRARLHLHRQCEAGAAMKWSLAVGCTPRPVASGNLIAGRAETTLGRPAARVCCRLGAAHSPQCHNSPPLFPPLAELGLRASGSRKGSDNKTRNPIAGEPAAYQSTASELSLSARDEPSSRVALA